MAGIGKKGNFAELVGDGENPNGVRVEYPGGVSHGGLGEDYYRQWSAGPNNAGPRWGGPAPMMGVPGMMVASGADDQMSMSELKGDKLKGGR